MWPLKMKPQKSPRSSTDLRVSWSGRLDEKYFQVCKRVKHYQIALGHEYPRENYLSS